MRLDRNYSYHPAGTCPTCTQDGRTFAFLSIPREGRSDIVRCWRCGYEGQRFIEIPDDLAKEKKRRGSPHVPRRQREDWE